MRRMGPPLYKARWCGDTRVNTLHDLDNETRRCKIDDILATHSATPFDYAADADILGYAHCKHCMPKKKR